MTHSPTALEVRQPIVVYDDLPDRCPKCGHEPEDFDTWIGPFYQSWRSGPDENYRDALRYQCRSCGYERYVPCRDAEGIKS